MTTKRILLASAIALLVLGVWYRSVSRTTEAPLPSTPKDWHEEQLADLSLKLELPDAWSKTEPDYEGHTKTFMSDDKNLTLSIIRDDAGAKSLQDVMKERGESESQGYEGQASVKIAESFEAQVAGFPAVLQKRELLAAGLRDIAITFVAENSAYVISLRRESDAGPSPSDENLFRRILSTLKVGG